MVVIGYQGVEGSNSEYAALKLAKKQGITNYQLLPLVSSFNVLDNKIKKRIDYGVIAVENSQGGKVKESEIVLEHLRLEKVDSITIPITHYVYVKNDGVSIENISKIVSHPQAFKQCMKTLSQTFGHVSQVPDEDTATAARKLSLGIFDEDVAVICRKNAGEMNELTLLTSNIEDRDDNKTTFEMY